MTATAPERNFTVFPRGEIRDEILTSFRYGLRQIDNPDTGVAFSETEIATATARLSRFWIEADAIDLVLLTVQNRDLFFADQARPDRANHEFLTNYHGVLWDVAKLEASGGSGQVLAPATTGTIFTGSTTIPDAAAIYGTDPQGLRFQVLFTATATAGGITINGEAVDGATLQIKGIDTGPDTNLAAATEIKWANAPPGAPAPAIVDSDDFTGGFGDETDAEFARRILTAIREKEGAGNNPEMRAWAKSASTAVEDAFIYACALHAGSVRVAIVQKRGDVEGPTGREPAVERGVHARAGIDCTTCHGGVGGTTDAAAAHGDDLRALREPQDALASCGSCHSDVERMRLYGLRTDQLALYAHEPARRGAGRGTPRPTSPRASAVTARTPYSATRIRARRSTDATRSRPAASCHSDPERMDRLRPAARTWSTNYRESVHGRALLARSTAAAPACTDCHGSHGAAAAARAQRSRRSAAIATRSCSDTSSGARTSPARPARRPSSAPPATATTASTQPSAAMFLGDEEGHCGSCHDADGGDGHGVAAALHDEVARPSTRRIEEAEEEIRAASSARPLPGAETGYLDERAQPAACARVR